MVQVGWRSACSGVTDRELLRAAAPERAARGGQDPGLHALGRHALEQLEERRVLGVDRHERRAGAGPRRGHQVAARDQGLLVGQRHRQAAPDRGQRRPQPRRAHQRVQHDVRPAGLDQAVEAGVVLDRAAAAGAGGVLHAVRRRLGGHLVAPPAAGQAAGDHVGRGVDDLQGLDADGARGAEDEDADHLSECSEGPIARPALTRTGDGPPCAGPRILAGWRTAASRSCWSPASARRAPARPPAPSCAASPAPPWATAAARAARWASRSRRPGRGAASATRPRPAP